MGGSVWDFIAPIAGGALGSVVPGVGTAIGAAIGSGLKTGVETGDPLAGLVTAGTSYLGSEIGGELLGDTLGGIANDAGFGASLGPGSTIGEFAGGALLDAPVGSIVGSSIGSSLGESFFPGNAIRENNIFSGLGLTDVAGAAAAPFEPKREEAMARPSSFQAFGSLSPEQETSAIATQGVYGGGVGKQEQDYYQNLINRQLVDEGGGLRDVGQLSPINRGYLSQLGYGQGNTRDLLEAMQKWKMQA